MKRSLIVIATATTIFSVNSMAQSAKFAASWDTNPRAVFASAASELTGSNDVCIEDNIPEAECLVAEVEMATLHVGSKKSILVGVSSEILINLLTVAKGGRKDVGDVETNFSSTAKAEGSVDVALTLVDGDGVACPIAPSSGVTLKSEMRELTVSGGGDLPLPTDTDFWIEVGIETDSKGAHHFEFLGVECEQGMYTLTATFNLTALAEASGEDANSAVTVTLYDRMITMQEVRAVKGSLVSDSEVCTGNDVWDPYLGQCVAP